MLATTGVAAQKAKGSWIRVTSISWSRITCDNARKAALQCLRLIWMRLWLFGKADLQDGRESGLLFIGF